MKGTWKLGKDDWSLTGFALLVVLVVTAMPLAAGIYDLLSGKPLRMTTGAVVPAPAVDDPMLQPGVSGVFTPEAVFTIEHPTAMQWLAALLVPLVTLVVAVVCLLRSVASSATPAAVTPSIPGPTWRSGYSACCCSPTDCSPRCCTC